MYVGTATIIALRLTSGNPSYFDKFNICRQNFLIKISRVKSLHLV